MQQPYFNPITPFVGRIQGGLQEGKTITVTGRVMPAAQRFHVNLQCGSGNGADIALHFNPRFEKLRSYVVCNTLNNGAWGEEERKYETPTPRGSNFTIIFLVNRDSYSIMVNGVHFMEYLHRLPIGRVNTISVDGGVELNSIAFQNPTHVHYQPAYQIAQKSFAQGCFMTPPPYTPGQFYVVPYKCIVSGGMYPGRSVIVQGVVNSGAVRFDFNLRFNDGIALHFNPRFNEGTVVRNSFLKGKWGSEERSGGLPFYCGQPFTVTIVSEGQCYRVSVNGAQMFSYQHRHHNLHEIDVLEVNGDVSLSSVVV